MSQKNVTLNFAVAGLQQAKDGIKELAAESNQLQKQLNRSDLTPAERKTIEAQLQSVVATKKKAQADRDAAVAAIDNENKRIEAATKREKVEKLQYLVTKENTKRDVESFVRAGEQKSRASERAWKANNERVKKADDQRRQNESEEQKAATKREKVEKLQYLAQKEDRQRTIDEQKNMLANMERMRKKYGGEGGQSAGWSFARNRYARMAAGMVVADTLGKFNAPLGTGFEMGVGAHMMGASPAMAAGIGIAVALAKTASDVYETTRQGVIASRTETVKMNQELRASTRNYKEMEATVTTARGSIHRGRAMDLAELTKREMEEEENRQLNMSWTERFNDRISRFWHGDMRGSTLAGKWGARGTLAWFERQEAAKEDVRERESLSAGQSAAVEAAKLTQTPEGLWRKGQELSLAQREELRLAEEENRKPGKSGSIDIGKLKEKFSEQWKAYGVEQATLVREEEHGISVARAKATESGLEAEWSILQANQKKRRKEYELAKRDTSNLSKLEREEEGEMANKFAVRSVQLAASVETARLAAANLGFAGRMSVMRAEHKAELDAAKARKDSDAIQTAIVEKNKAIEARAQKEYDIQMREQIRAVNDRAAALEAYGHVAVSRASEIAAIERKVTDTLLDQAKAQEMIAARKREWRAEDKNTERDSTRSAWYRKAIAEGRITEAEARSREFARAHPEADARAVKKAELQAEGAEIEGGTKIGKFKQLRAKLDEIVESGGMSKQRRDMILRGEMAQMMGVGGDFTNTVGHWHTLQSAIIKSASDPMAMTAAQMKEAVDIWQEIQRNGVQIKA